MSADIKEIYDEIYYGCDIEFKYGNWYYIIGSGGKSLSYYVTCLLKI